MCGVRHTWSLDVLLRVTKIQLPPGRCTRSSRALDLREKGLEVGKMEERAAEGDIELNGMLIDWRFCSPCPPAGLPVCRCQ